jgi:PPIC-type PPIASE domain
LQKIFICEKNHSCATFHFINTCCKKPIACPNKKDIRYHQQSNWLCKIYSVAVLSTSSFLGKADSLAYKGKVGKVYGPFKGENILVKILMKAPNTFYHVSHILLDTTNYRPRYAESLCDSILQKINTNTATFASLASTYSDDKGSSQKNGDLGWFARGALLPQLDAQLAKRKKGEIFKVWTAAGLHLVKIMDNPKQDVGYALMLRVLLN